VILKSTIKKGGEKGSQSNKKGRIGRGECGTRGKRWLALLRTRGKIPHERLPLAGKTVVLANNLVRGKERHLRSCVTGESKLKKRKLFSCCALELPQVTGEAD